MYTLRRKILWFALSSRLFLIFLQAVANNLIPDHKADAFTSPILDTNTTSYGDMLIQKTLGGFNRWDAQYFMHISQYGYTYENTLAFFPLYPLVVRVAAEVAKVFLGNFLAYHSTLLLSAVLLNVYFFTKAALTLHQLTLVVLGDEKLAYISSILFCVNPASIFFSAPYSESVYAWLSFAGMLRCLDKTDIRFGNIAITTAVPFGLSCVARSNGLLNIGFILYHWTRNGVQKMWPEVVNRYRTLKTKWVTPLLVLPFVAASIQIIITLLVTLAVYVLVQIYNYRQFCTRTTLVLPEFLVQYAESNKFVMPGYGMPPWCDEEYPIAYSYVQSHYWNVGFMRYYKWKQIPNFLLAFPLISIILWNTWKFIKQHSGFCLRLGIFPNKYQDITKKRPIVKPLYSTEMFVYYVHATALVIFCLLFVHIQVTTRLVCSASPVLYWSCAYMFNSKLTDKNPTSIRTTVIGQNQRTMSFDFENLDNMYSKWKTFLITESLSGRESLIRWYFLSYFVIGTILFSNFYPWT
ncbi:GPI mannosyltransferase 2-like [Ctenocephalides felis]|uniref:GPI mannosyltransferase 2-like n=1 Tax=Ctenocephalides felis TaxID=7515 RepID=UPI000E6E3A22|nr:GPI mannosyltransferase 2-like [Ctenocephalides felis]